MGARQSEFSDITFSDDEDYLNPVEDTRQVMSRTIPQPEDRMPSVMDMILPAAPLPGAAPPPRGTVPLPGAAPPPPPGVLEALARQPRAMPRPLVPKKPMSAQDAIMAAIRNRGGASGLRKTAQQPAGNATPAKSSREALLEAIRNGRPKPKEKTNEYVYTSRGVCAYKYPEDGDRVFPSREKCIEYQETVQRKQFKVTRWRGVLMSSISDGVFQQMEQLQLDIDSTTASIATLSDQTKPYVRERTYTALITPQERSAAQAKLDEAERTYEQAVGSISASIKALKGRREPEIEQQRQNLIALKIEADEEISMKRGEYRPWIENSTRLDKKKITVEPSQAAIEVTERKLANAEARLKSLKAKYTKLEKKVSKALRDWSFFIERLSADADFASRFGDFLLSQNRMKPDRETLVMSIVDWNSTNPDKVCAPSEFVSQYATFLGPDEIKLLSCGAYDGRAMIGLNDDGDADVSDVARTIASCKSKLAALNNVLPSRPARPTIPVAANCSEMVTREIFDSYFLDVVIAYGYRNVLRHLEALRNRCPSSTETVASIQLASDPDEEVRRLQRSFVPLMKNLEPLLTALKTGSSDAVNLFKVAEEEFADLSQCILDDMPSLKPSAEEGDGMCTTIFSDYASNRTLTPAQYLIRIDQNGKLYLSKTGPWVEPDHATQNCEKYALKWLDNLRDKLHTQSASMDHQIRIRVHRRAAKRIVLIRPRNIKKSDILMSNLATRMDRD